jgi:hypothetical protein
VGQGVLFITIFIWRENHLFSFLRPGTGGVRIAMHRCAPEGATTYLLHITIQYVLTDAVRIVLDPSDPFSI